MQPFQNATNFMICGLADGALLPSNVIYRRKEGGPKGNPLCNQPCCSQAYWFNRISHGCMDFNTFED